MTPGLLIKEGPRIRIRQLRENDIPRMAAGGFGGEDGVKRLYAQEIEKPDGPPGPDGKQLAVETKDGAWIGFTGFGAKRDGDAGGYFYIAEPFRGQGYGTELVRLVLQVMFEECGAARCLLDYHDWNQVTRRITIPEDKLTDEDRAMAPGGPVHAVIIELTREAWRSLQA